MATLIFQTLGFQPVRSLRFRRLDIGKNVWTNAGSTIAPSICGKSCANKATIEDHWTRRNTEDRLLKSSGFWECFPLYCCAQDHLSLSYLSITCSLGTRRAAEQFYKADRNVRWDQKVWMVNNNHVAITGSLRITTACSPKSRYLDISISRQAI